MSLSAWSPSCYSQQQRHCCLFLMPVFVKRRRGAQLSRGSVPTTGTASSITTAHAGSPGRNMLAAWWDFLMTKRENARPAQPPPLVKTDLATLPLGQDVMVWLGHSRVPAAGGKTHPDRPGVQRLRGAVLFINAFPATIRGGRKGCRDRSADHLPRSLRPSGYATPCALLPKIKRVITPLGVGSHLRYWNGRGADYRSGLAAGGTGQRRAHRPRAAGAALFRPWAEA